MTPEQIARLIAEDPDDFDEYEGLPDEDEFEEEEEEEEAERIWPEDIIQMFLSLADNPVDLLRKWQIAGFVEDNLTDNQYIGNKSIGYLSGGGRGDGDPENPNDIFLDAYCIWDSEGLGDEIDEALSDYWYEIMMALCNHAYSRTLEGPHSSSGDFYAITKEPDPKNDNPLGHAIDRMLT